MLTIIDIFSKYAWVIPLKNKTGNSITKAFESISRRPKNLWVDRGTEFYNSTFEKFLKDNNINMYSTNSKIKSSVAERFNRTILEKIFKKMNNKNIISIVSVMLYSNTITLFIQLLKKNQ